MLERCGEPVECAAAILCLLSDNASFITAADLAVDGDYRRLGSDGLGKVSRFAGSAETRRGTPALSICMLALVASSFCSSWAALRLLILGIIYIHDDISRRRALAVSPHDEREIRRSQTGLQNGELPTYDRLYNQIRIS